MPIARLTMVLLLFAGPALGEPLSVEVRGNHSPGATLYIAVYESDAEGWEAPLAARHKTTLPEARTLTVTLDLEPGTYALRAFVDLDEDGELNLNAKDRPLEPYASSIGEGRYQPSVFFSRSVFVFDRRRPHLELELRYPEGAEDRSAAQ